MSRDGFSIKKSHDSMSSMNMDDRMESMELRMDRAMCILEKMSEQVTELVFLARKGAKQKSGRMTGVRLPRSTVSDMTRLEIPDIKPDESLTFELSFDNHAHAVTIQKTLRGHLARKNSAFVRLQQDKTQSVEKSAWMETENDIEANRTPQRKSLNTSKSLDLTVPNEDEKEANARKSLDFFQSLKRGGNNKNSNKVAPALGEIRDDKVWYNAVVAAIPPNPISQRMSQSPKLPPINSPPNIKPSGLKPRRKASVFTRWGLYFGVSKTPSAKYGVQPDHTKSVAELKAVVAHSAANETVTLKAKKKDFGYTRVVSKNHTFMINPKGRFRLSWDFLLVTPMLVYLAVMMPFRLCFANEPKTFSAIYWFEFMIDIIFLCDICFNFRTGYFVNAVESDVIEYDSYQVAKNYFFSWFLLDLASGIPFSLIELIFASGPNTSGIKTLKTVRLIRFIKLGRLFKIEKILTNMDRDTMDRIEDFFQDNNTRSALVIFGLALKTGFVCHLLSCLWVFIGRQGSKNGVDNWLEYELKGAFDYTDTVGGGPSVSSIYLAAFYFCLTTMASVGYGDIICRNNTERIFAILLEFTGSLVFAMIVAALTSVVTTMDTNARKTAEQLDSVASFVVNRNFPDALGRRIRRHFRHFYSLKSAIDESKIFGELSTSLRKEVSAYLVSELMGDVSLFTTMSPLLWPHLLPVLRPMRFEAEEIVCQQDEECGEMYVVLSGTLTGMTEVEGEDDIRVRRATSGDTFNVLCVLGIWSRCVETVIADVSVETYAISEKDFGNLFTAETDLNSLEEMKDREVNNFKMETVVEVGSVFLKPLYICIFSRLDLTIISAKDLAVADYNGSSDPYAYVELVDTHLGHSLSKMYTFKTSTISKSLNPLWLESLQWMDITTPFNRVALRISLYDSDFVGIDTFLGMVQIPFPQLLKECNISRFNHKTSLTGGDRRSSSSNSNSSSFASPTSGGSGGGGLLFHDGTVNHLEPINTNGVGVGAESSPVKKNIKRNSNTPASPTTTAGGGNGSGPSNQLERKLLARNASLSHMHNHHKSFSVEELPELKPGQVEKVYKLQPAFHLRPGHGEGDALSENSPTNSNGGENDSSRRQSIRALASRLTKLSVPTSPFSALSHVRDSNINSGDDDEDNGSINKDVFEVAEVTGEIKIRFYVEKAEREASRPPRFYHKTHH